MDLNLNLKQSLHASIGNNIKPLDNCSAHGSMEDLPKLLNSLLASNSHP